MRRFNISPRRRRNKTDATNNADQNAAARATVTTPTVKTTGSPLRGPRSISAPSPVSILNSFKKGKKNVAKPPKSPAYIDPNTSMSLLGNKNKGDGGPDHDESYLSTSMHSSLQQQQLNESHNTNYDTSDIMLDQSFHSQSQYPRVASTGNFSTMRDDNSTVGDGSTIGDNTLNTYETNASDNNTLSSRRIGRLNKKKRALFKKLVSSREKMNESSGGNASTMEKILASSFQMSSVDAKSFASPHIMPSKVESHSSEFSFMKNDDDDDDYDDYMNVDPWSPGVSRDLEDENGEPAFAPDPFANFNIEAALEEEAKAKEESEQNVNVNVDETPPDEKINTIIDISPSKDDLSTGKQEETTKALSSSPPPPPPRDRDHGVISPFVPHVGSNVRVDSSSASVGSRVSSIGNSLEDGIGDEPIMHITDYMKLSESDRLQAYCDLFSTAANMMKDVEDKRQEIFDMGRQVDDLFHRVVEFEEEKKSYIVKDEESRREIKRLTDAVNDRQRNGIDFRSVLSSRSGHLRQPSEEAMLRTELEAKDVIIEALKKSVDEWKSQDQQHERRQEQEKRDDDEVERIQKLLKEKEMALQNLQIEMERKIAEKDIKLKEKNEVIEKKDAEVTTMRKKIDEKETILKNLQSNPNSVSQLNKKILALASGELKAVKKELEETKRTADEYEAKIAKLEKEKLEIDRTDMNVAEKTNFEDSSQCNSSKMSPARPSHRIESTGGSSVDDGRSEAAVSSISQNFNAHEIPVGTVKARIAMAAARVAKNSAPGPLAPRQLHQKEPQNNGFAKSMSTVDNAVTKNEDQRSTEKMGDSSQTKDLEEVLEQLREKESKIQRLEDEHRNNVSNLLSEKTDVEHRASVLEKKLAEMEIEMKELAKANESKAQLEKSTDDQGKEASSVSEEDKSSKPQTNDNTTHEEVALKDPTTLAEDTEVSKENVNVISSSNEVIETLQHENKTLKAKINQMDKEIEDVSGLLQETILSIKGWNEEIDNEEFIRSESNGRSERGEAPKRLVGTTQYTDEEVIQLEKLAKIHQLSVIRQRRTICSLDEALKKSSLELEKIRAEAKANEEKVTILETQFAELNSGVDKNTTSPHERCGSDAETSASIIKIDAAYVSSLETGITQNRETITELQNKIRQLKQRNLTLRAKMVPGDELRSQLDEMRLKLQAKDLEIVELEKAYMTQNNADGGLPQSTHSSKASLSATSDGKDLCPGDNEDMDITELRNILAKRDETLLQLRNQLSKLEKQPGGENPVLDIRKVSLLQEMQDAIIRRLNILMSRIDENREGEGEEMDEYASPSKLFLISMSDKLSLLHDYQKISLHLLQSRLSNEIESLRTGTKPIKIDEEVIGRFDRTKEAFEDYEKEIKSQLGQFDSEIKNHRVKLTAKNEVIEKLLKSDTENRSKVEVLQSELNEFKGLSVYSSVNAGVMARFKQCAELEQELEEKERVIERLNNVIAEYRIEQATT